MLDIKITNAKTRNTGKELVEIGIENGKITAIASRFSSSLTFVSFPEDTTKRGKAGYRCKRKPGNRVLCKRTPSSV